MNQNSKIIKEFYSSRDLNRELQRLQHFLKHKERYDTDLPNLIVSINELANNLEFKTEFKKLLKKYIENSNDSDFENLKDYTYNYFKKVEKDFIDIPNSIEKSYDLLRALIELDLFEKDFQVYDAIILLKEEISNKKLEKIFLNWKENGDEIWISYDFMNDVDAISHYRFKKTFNLQDFDLIFKKEEYELQFRLLEFLFAEDIKNLTFYLWLIDRIPDYINYNRDLISFILKFIARQWNSKGYWESNVIKTTHERVIEEGEPHEHPDIIFGEKINVQIGINEEGKLTEKKIEWEPSNYITALSSLNLLKHPISDDMMEMGISGAKWLSQRQNSDGSWSDFDFRKKNIKYADGKYFILKEKNDIQPDLFVTLIAIEAIFRSNIPNKERYINRGFEWIKKQQDKFGRWNYDELFKYSIFPLITVLVLELEKLISKNTIFPNSDYLTMSKDFLNSSIRFLSDESLNSRRLAIITAYHGIEFFLYSALTDNRKQIFDNGQTIGMVKALNKFQEFLKSKNKIKKGGIIDFKNSLLELKNYRDNIIHRGYNIEKSKCEDLVEKARKFASKYSILLWNNDILG